MQPDTMEAAAALKLDSTEEMLGGTQIGPHDNTQADPSTLEQCLDELDKVGGN